MSDDARFRMSAIFCSVVRPSWRPALRCRIASLLHVVGRGGGGAARRRAPIEHANATVATLLEPHPEIQSFALEQIGDLLERLLTEILYLQDLALRLPDEVAKRSDIRILE